MSETTENVMAIRELLHLPATGDLFTQIADLEEDRTVSEVRLHNAVGNLMAEPIYEDGEMSKGISVRFMMRLHLLACESGHPAWQKNNPLVAEAMAALGDPAESSPEALAARRLTIERRHETTR